MPTVTVCGWKDVHSTDYTLQKIKIEMTFRCSVQFNIAGDFIPPSLLVRAANEDPKRLLCNTDAKQGAHLNKNHAGGS